MLPLTRGYAWTDFIAEGYHTANDRDRVVADVHVVTPGYFETLEIPVLAGRSFARADANGPSVVMVDRQFAERFWSVTDAVGRWIGRNPENRSTIIGVVDDVKHYGLDEASRLTVFYQHADSGRATLYGVVRATHDDDEPTALAPPLRDARLERASLLVERELDLDILGDEDAEGKTVRAAAFR